MQIVPLRFCHIGIKKERSVAFKIRQNPLSTGALPRTPLGELTTLSRPHSWLGGNTLPIPYPIPLGTNPPSALAMRPPEFQPDLRLWLSGAVKDINLNHFVMTKRYA